MKTNNDIFSGFNFNNGLLEEPIEDFNKKLEIFFPGEKYNIFRYQVIDLFTIDKSIYNKIDDNRTINKIFLLEIKIFKRHILDLITDSNPDQQDILNEFLKLVNKNLTNVNEILVSNSNLDITPLVITTLPITPLSMTPQDKMPLGVTLLSQQGGGKSYLDTHMEPNINNHIKKFIVSEWIEQVDKIFESDNLENAINEFVIIAFKSNGFKLVQSDEQEIKQIINQMCDNLKIINDTKIQLEIYNKKYVSLHLNKSIKSIGSLKKTSILLLTKTFLDKYLDMLIQVVDYKLTSLEKILIGGDISNKYLKYKIKYLINKIFIYNN